MHCSLRKAKYNFFSSFFSGCPGSVASLRGFYWEHEHTPWQVKLDHFWKIYSWFKKQCFCVNRGGFALCALAISAHFKAPVKLYIPAKALDMGTAVGPQSVPALRAILLVRSCWCAWELPLPAAPILPSTGTNVFHTSLSPSSLPDQLAQLQICTSSFNLISDSCYYLRKSKLPLPVLMNHCTMCVGIREQDEFINVLLIKGTVPLFQWLLVKGL